MATPSPYLRVDDEGNEYLDGDAWAADRAAGPYRPATHDEYTRLSDGRVLDTKAKLVAWLEEVALAVAVEQEQPSP